MPATKAQLKATNKYNSANYDNLRIVVPKGRKETVEACAKAESTTINGLVNTLLREKCGLTEAEWKEKATDATGDE